MPSVVPFGFGSRADEKELANAIEILKKQRDDNLLLIKTEHQMRLDSATKLAKYEEERLESFFDVVFASGFDP